MIVMESAQCEPFDEMTIFAYSDAFIQNIDAVDVRTIWRQSVKINTSCKWKNVCINVCAGVFVRVTFTFGSIER